MKINGKQVIDAKKKLKITISAKDVQKGNSKDPASCAAALSCIRETHCTQARVHIGRTYLLRNNKWVRYHTPLALRSEIVAFDRGAKFHPGEYILTPMQPSHRASGKRQGSYPKKKGGKNRPYHRVYGVREWGANR